MQNSTEKKKKKKKKHEKNKHERLDRKRLAVKITKPHKIRIPP